MRSRGRVQEQRQGRPKSAAPPTSSELCKIQTAPGISGITTVSWWDVSEDRDRSKEHSPRRDTCRPGKQGLLFVRSVMPQVPSSGSPHLCPGSTLITVSLRFDGLVPESYLAFHALNLLLPGIVAFIQALELGVTPAALPDRGGGCL